MAKILMFKKGGALFPLDDADKERMRKLAQGEVIGIEVRKNRNWLNHRRYFAFVSESFDLQDEFTDAEVWRKYLQCLAGHFDLQVMADGRQFYAPRSIAWEELDEIEFQEVFAHCIDAFIDWYEKRKGPLPHEAMMRLMGFL